MTKGLPPLTVPHVAMRHWHIERPTALTAPSAAALPVTVTGGNWLHYRGNKLTYQLTSAARSAGVQIMSFAQYATQYPEQLRAVLADVVATNQVAQQQHTALAQHTACGWVLLVPANVTVADVAIEQQLTPQTTGINVGLIICGANSRVSVVERLTAAANLTGHAQLSRLVALAAGAHVTYSNCDELPAGVISYVRRTATLAEHAQLATHNVQANLGKTISATEIALRGAFATANAALVGVASQTATTVHTTKITNYAANTSGEINQRAVAGACGQMIVNGIGQIVAGKNANAQQTSRMLMLSKTARGQVNPILLIDDNEVTAGHAASVGQVDQAQLFYLQSRGLPLPVAKHLLVTSFFKELLEQIPNAALKQATEALIEGRLMDFYANNK